jgi:hypothetical protein
MSRHEGNIGNPGHLPLKAVVLSIGKLSNSDDACMGIFVITVPEFARLGPLCQVSQGSANELDGRCCVCDKYQVKVFRVCP